MAKKKSKLDSQENWGTMGKGDIREQFYKNVVMTTSPLLDCLFGLDVDKFISSEPYNNWFFIKIQVLHCITILKWQIYDMKHDLYNLSGSHSPSPLSSTKIGQINNVCTTWIANWDQSIGKITQLKHMEYNPTSNHYDRIKTNF